MTVREWLATDRTYRKQIRQIRRELIVSKALDKAPFWSRLWNAHGYWALHVCLYEVRSATQFAGRSFLIRYYRTADRIFGGTRYVRYQERQLQLAERHERKAAELQEYLEERERKNFAREIIHQALTNPKSTTTSTKTANRGLLF